MVIVHIEQTDFVSMYHPTTIFYH